MTFSIRDGLTTTPEETDAGRLEVYAGPAVRVMFLDAAQWRERVYIVERAGREMAVCIDHATAMILGNALAYWAARGISPEQAYHLIRELQEG